ncbi:MAG: 50S ribosomal protein L24 [Spirochaetia bacterium]|nr:50S ribosomal protein L24 [Spirochaetia bacterium]
MKAKKNTTKLRKDDEVIVIAGSEKGKRGKVLHVDAERSKIFIQGIKKVKKFQRPSQENPKGGILELESGIHLSNVMYYDSKNKKGVRLGSKKENGKKIRVTRPEGKGL